MIPSRRIGARTRERVRREAEDAPVLGLFLVIVPVLLLAAAAAHVTAMDAGAVPAATALSSPAPSAATPSVALRIRVAREGILIAEQGGRPAPVRPGRLSAALERLRAGRPAGPLTVVAAPRAPYREVRRALDLARRAGFDPVRLETAP